MGQAANNKRNANLDEKKKRATGRQKQLTDAFSENLAKGTTAGAFGKEQMPRSDRAVRKR